MSDTDKLAIVFLFTSIMLRVIAADFADIYKVVAIAIFFFGAALLLFGGRDD